MVSRQCLHIEDNGRFKFGMDIIVSWSGRSLKFVCPCVSQWKSVFLTDTGGLAVCRQNNLITVHGFAFFNIFFYVSEQ